MLSSFCRARVKNLKFIIVANLTGIIQVDGDELLTSDWTGMILM